MLTTIEGFYESAQESARRQRNSRPRFHDAITRIAPLLGSVEQPVVELSERWALATSNRKREDCEEFAVKLELARFGHAESGNMRLH